ncbi:MAG: MFS transporter [Anderseniella sp.]|nr:MFS transporter [Anderseniella sp.]
MTSRSAAQRLPHPAPPAPIARATLIWSLSALAFGYAFFQRVAPSVMVNDLMAEFAVSGAVLGQLSALYFYPYAAMQLPIGALLDRYGARLMLSIALLAAGAGSALFAFAPRIEFAYAGRFLIGAGSAVGFIGSMALASNWFHPRHFAFLTGGSMFFAMMCGIAGQAPLALAVEAVGWRNTMMWAAGFALLLSLVVAVVVRNSPNQRTQDEEGDIRWAQIWSGLKQTVRRREVWRLAIVAMAMSGPMLALGGLWGVPFLSSAYGLDRASAAFYTSLSLFGWALGAPGLGWLSDRLRLRKAPIVIFAGLNVASLAAIALVPGLPLLVIATLFFVSGFTGGCMVITFAIAREVSPKPLHGTVSGLVNGMTVAAGAVLQPVIGWLLDLRWDGTLLEGARVYQAADYRFAFIALLIWSGIGFTLSFGLRETRCRPIPVLR